MPKANSSLDLYSALARELPYRSSALEKSDIEQLLDSARYELIVSNGSPLMDAAYFSCRLFFSNHPMPLYRFKPSSFVFSDSGRRTKIPPFDAWWMILLLSEYLPGESIAEDIDSLLPYFFGNYMPHNPDAAKLLIALQGIDEEIRLQRKKMYKLYTSKSGGPAMEASLRDSAAGIDRTQTEAFSAAVPPAAEKDKEAILSAARTQAEEEGRRIVDAAQAEGERIIQRASFEAEKKISAARKKQAERMEDSRKQTVLAEQQLQQGFSEVRTALLQANERIKKLEDTVSEASVKKIAAQLLELFNLIADSKESAFGLARKNGDQDLENTAYNMDVFLDMIVEYMEEYGISPIASAPGDRFASKYHTVGFSSRQFDPRSASIKVSKRIGFLWGEQVLQKEQVEV